MPWRRCCTWITRAQAGEWIPNQVRRAREPRRHRFPAPAEHADARRTPGTITAAEESTSFPGVSRPVHLGGLGFHLQVEHGLDARHARVHAQRSGVPALVAQRCSRSRCSTTFTENFILPFSHDEVVHGKGRCSTRCRATRGRSTPRCGRCTASCSGTPARSCCSWATSSASRASGTTIAASTGTCSTIPRMQACGATCSSSTGTPAQRAVTLRDRLRRAGFRWIDCSDNENSVVSLMRTARDPHDFVVMVVQLHAGAALRLSHRRAAARLLR